MLDPTLAPLPRDRTTDPGPARPDPTAPGRLVVWTVLLSAAATLPLVGFWREIADPYQVSLSVLHTLVCALGAAVAVYRRLRPCLLVASVFPYCWLVVASAYQMANGAAAWGDPGVTADFSATLRGQGVLLLGQAALVVGYAVRAGRDGGREVRRWSPTLPEVARIQQVTTVFLLAALVLVPFVVVTVGGIAPFFSSRDVFNASLGAAGDRETVGLVALVKIVPSSFATAAAVLSLWVLRTDGASDRQRRRARWSAALATAMLLVVANPLVYTRFLFLACFGSVAMALLVPRSAAAARVVLLVALSAFLLAYPAAQLLQGDVAQVDPILASKDFDGFQQAINTVSYVDDEGIFWGMHLVSGLLFFVPRAIWSGKEVPSAFPVAEHRGYVFQNLSMPFPSEAYLDLGWVGVVVVLALLGYCWASLDRAWLTGHRLAVVAAYVAVAQVGLWRGPFGSLVPIFGFTILLLLAAPVLAARVRPPDLD